MLGVYRPPCRNAGSPVDRHGQEIAWLFVPDYSRWHYKIPASLLIKYNPVTKVNHLMIDTVGCESDTLVISIDGACRNNGRPDAQASWGVYVGPGSPYNANGRLAASLPQTSTRAEIEALSQALSIVRNIIANNRSLKEVIIRCDSQYLCMSMALWMDESWIQNGGYASKGQPVVHYEKLREIYDELKRLQYGGLLPRFWNVPRSENSEADRLANEALDVDRRPLYYTDFYYSQV